MQMKKSCIVTLVSFLLLFIFARVLLVREINSTDNTPTTKTAHCKQIEKSAANESAISPIENPDLWIPITVTYYDVPFTYDQQNLFRSLCDYYDFEIELLYKIGWCESGWNIDNSMGKNPCKGWLAVSENYRKWYQDNYDDPFNDLLTNYSPYDPVQNAIIAIRMLDRWRAHGAVTPEQLISCYNKGYAGKTQLSTSYINKAFNKELVILEEVTYWKLIK